MNIKSTSSTASSTDELPSQAVQPQESPPQGLREDVAQALFLISSILSLNDDPDIQPGQLQGMSQVLAHAKKAWSEMKTD